ncbi:MAG: helix-turn-helix domain-containing protein [Actinomycetota bacterium]|nr:helix-turn-helix domain-containing protein [Actinomycetota bacterium]
MELFTRSQPEANGPDHMKLYLTVAEAAEYLNTSERFVRRLIAERRIPFHHIGRHVRLAPADLDTFVLAGRVDAITVTSARGHLRGVA